MARQGRPKRDKIIRFGIAPEQMNVLKISARKKGVTLSTLIREIILRPGIDAWVKEESKRRGLTPREFVKRSLRGDFKGELNR